MKKHCHAKTNGNGLPTYAVRFEFADPNVKTVSIAGTFNDWRPESTPMIALENGHWVKDVVLPSGIYEYRIIADGRWMADPRVSDTIANPFGGLNSVLKVPQDAEATASAPSPKTV